MLTWYQWVIVAWLIVTSVAMALRMMSSICIDARVTDTGLELRTLLRRRVFVPWRRIREQVEQFSGPVGERLVFRLVPTGFLALRTYYAVRLSSLPDADQFMNDLSRFRSVLQVRDVKALDEALHARFKQK
jgi:hypothetical protein